MYGHRLVSAFGEVPPNMWRMELDKLSPEQFARGVERLRTRHLSDESERTIAWPPGLTDFLRWCTEEPPAPPEHREFPPLALPEPDHIREARIERGRAHIQAALVKLRGGAS